MVNEDPTEDPMIDRLFDTTAKMRFAMALADRAFEEAAKRPAPPCPTWCTLDEGHPYQPREIGPSSAVEREHTMTIHYLLGDQPFDAIISQLEIQYSDDTIERKMPSAHVTLNTKVLNPDHLTEVAKTVELTAENLRRIQA